MDVLFQKSLVKVKPNGVMATWSIRVESPGSGRGAFIITEQKSNPEAAVATRKKPILKGKRMRSTRPQYPDELAVTEANSRVLEKLSKGYVDAQ